MKKLFALILALCLCFTVAACANGASLDDTVNTQPTENGVEAPTLNVWAIESSVITDYATNAQSLWMEEQTGVSVNWMAVPQNGWYSAFQASVMGGEEVDVYIYPFDTMELEMLGTQMQYVLPLEDLLTPELTPNICAILDANPGLKEQITAPDGHIYSLFANDVYVQDAYTQKLWVNRLFLEKYSAETGKGLPETTAEFEEMLVYFNTHDMNGNGQQDEVPYIGVSGVDGMYNIFGSFVPANSSGNGFGCYADDNGGLTFAYTQDAYKEALEYLSKLYAQGLIHPDTFSTNNENRYEFTSGEYSSVRAGVVTGVRASDVVQLINSENTMTYEDYIPLPPMAGPDGVRTITSVGETQVSLRNAITIHCDDPENAIKWLDAGYSEEARMYAIYGGLENVDWAYTEGIGINGADRIITRLTQETENGSWNGQGIVYRVTEEDYLSMDATEIATNSALATYRANTMYRPYMVKNQWPSIVWPGEYTEEAAQYSEINGLISKAVTEYYTSVILGDKNLDSDWAAYTQSLNDMGLEQYIDLVDLYISSAK